MSNSSSNRPQASAGQSPGFAMQSAFNYAPPQSDSDTPSLHALEEYSTATFTPEEPPLKNMPLLEHLELSNFKVLPCTNMASHNHKQCKFYHSAKDRRRGNVQYLSELCEYVEQDRACPLGDKCPKAHNKVEQLYSPDKYKTKFCTLYPYNCHNCEYGPYCSFAHTENDIMIELIHNYVCDDDFYIFYYKTVWCPFNFIQHDRGMCVYAHNWQDFRRKPHQYKYDSAACQYWKPEDFITKYEEGCANQYNCNKCHGWKELEYHPLNYRTKPCSSGQACTKGQACPYYHTPQEKRIIPSNIQAKLFRLAPRNRLIANTYKSSIGLLPRSQPPKKSTKTRVRHSDQISCQVQEQLIKTHLANQQKRHSVGINFSSTREVGSDDSTEEPNIVSDNLIDRQSTTDKKKNSSTKKGINPNSQSFTPQTTPFYLSPPGSMPPGAGGQVLSMLQHQQQQQQHQQSQPHHQTRTIEEQQYSEEDIQDAHVYRLPPAAASSQAPPCANLMTSIDFSHPQAPQLQSHAQKTVAQNQTEKGVTMSVNGSSAAPGNSSNSAGAGVCTGSSNSAETSSTVAQNIAIQQQTSDDHSHNLISSMVNTILD